MMLEKTTITASIRPQKVAVVIPVDINEDDFRDILQFLGWLWGGKYSCIVPFDLNDEENELAFSWLTQYSPDVVLYANQDILNQVEGRIQELTDPPLQTTILKSPLGENFHINRGGGISWNPSYDRYVKEINSRPDTTTRYHFVSTEPGVANRIFYDLSFGIHTREGCEGLAKQFKAKSSHVEEGGIDEFIRLHDDKENPFSYLDFSGVEIDTINAHGAAPTLFILSRSILDYAWFWNCRFEFSEGGNICIPIPADLIDDDKTVGSIASWIGGYHQGRSTYCELKSISSTKQSLDKLARRLRPRVKKYGVNHVDVHLSPTPRIPFVNIRHKSQELTASWVDQDSFEFTPPKPSFVDEINDKTSARWLVELDTGYKLKGHTAPAVAYKTNSRVLSAPSPASPTWAVSGLNRRYSGGNIFISCSCKSNDIALTLPTAEELLLPYLAEFGIQPKTDEKRTCYDATFDLFGGNRIFAECCKDIRYKVIESLWGDRGVPCEDNGHSFSKGCRFKKADSPVPVPLEKIKQYVRIGKKWTKAFSSSSLTLSDSLMDKTYKARLVREGGFYRSNTPESFLSWLVKTGIVRRVFRYPECPTCMSESNWITEVDLSKPLNCFRCGGTILPNAAKFDMEYQLSSLVCRAFDEGIRPVALTLDVLKQAASGFICLPGFKGERNGKAFDVDVMAVCSGHLVFCECKDMAGVPTSSNDWAKIQKQFSDLIDLGELCGASSVVLASMADEYPSLIQKLVKSRSSDSLRVVLLRNKELLLGGIQEKRENGSEYKAQFYDAFLPKTKRRKKKKKGKRSVSFGWGNIQLGS